MGMLEREDPSIFKCECGELLDLESEHGYEVIGGVTWCRACIDKYPEEYKNDKEKYGKRN